MDRIDIHIDVPAVNYKEMRSTVAPEGSAQVRDRVMRAREIQLRRFMPPEMPSRPGTGPKFGTDTNGEPAQPLAEAPRGMEGNDCEEQIKASVP